MTASHPVVFPVESSGRIQLARTGTGFWRRDHPKRFAIDQALLSLMLCNTQLRKRPLRMDFMHYANASQSMPVEALGEAGCVDPADIVMIEWVEPATETRGWGLFAPSSFTAAGRCAIEAGVDEISPVIDWQYSLPEDVTDPETGETIPAGTMVGPCIIGLSLVDRGFFWMDKVKLYSEGGAQPHASLYQEYPMAQLTTDQLIKTLQALQKAGLADDQIMQMVGIDVEEAAAITDGPKAETPAAPEMPMAAAVPAVLAARVTAPAKPSTLSEVWAQVKKAAPTAQTPTGTQNFSEQLTAFGERLARIEASHDELMISDLERQGLLTGITDPRKLYREAPAYFAELVAKATPLTAPSPAAAGRPGGLRVIAKAAGLSEEDKFAVEVKAYREGQAKAGRKIDQQTAIEEYEQAQLQAARR